MSTKYATYRCENGHSFNVELYCYDLRAPRSAIAVVPEAYTVITMDIREDGHPGPAGYVRPETGEFKPYVRCSVLCPTCRSNAQDTNRRVRGSVGKTACEQLCETATSGQCTCQCGGMNHGVRA